jgi:hypothetical protein
MFHPQLIANFLANLEHIRQGIGKHSIKIKKDE